MKIILCADDFGYSTAVSEGILDLIELRRIRSTSVLIKKLAVDPNCSDLVQRLLHSDASIGLHFDLTRFSLIKLVLLSNLHLMSRKLKREIAKEFADQVDLFRKIFGKNPDFVDGHQHVHQFPVISAIIFAFYKKENWKPATRLVKNTNHPFFWLKARIIYVVSSIFYLKRLNKFHISHNTSFSGIYNFHTRKKYNEMFPQFVFSLDDNGLIMVHPKRREMIQYIDNNDLAKKRIEEYLYFKSDEFKNFCHDHFIAVSKFL